MTENQNTQIPKHPVDAFLAAFNVEADSLASQTVMYHSNDDAYSYDNTDVYGETAITRVIDPVTRNTILELNNQNEIDLIEQLSSLFHNCNHDKNEFIEYVQKQYATENKR